MARPFESRAAWNWLPAFLAVAESGSIVSAGRELGLTPAAVSRTIRLLEQQLGQSLFQRLGRALELNAAGLRLRASVRLAIDEVDVGLESLAKDPISGRLRVAAYGALAESAVLPSLLELRQEHPHFVPEQLALLPSEAIERLRRGQLDVAFQHEVENSEASCARAIGTVTFSVYCGRGHPLFDRKEVTWTALRRYSFCAPAQPDNERSVDGWPGERARSIGMRVSILQVAVRVAASGALLVALPDSAAAPWIERGAIRALISLPPREVFALTSPSGSRSATVAELVRRVEQRLSLSTARSSETGAPGGAAASA